MHKKLSPFVIGSFVLGALILVVVALLSFRSLNIFSKPTRFVAYFNESVQGLDVGSAVKLRGVRVGNVAAIQVHYDSNTHKSKVAVIAKLEKISISDRTGQSQRLSDPATLRRLIDEGLRAKMDLVGITGLQFVELDFVDPKEFPLPLLEGNSEYPVVPTLRSGLSEMVANLSRVVSNLKQVDFAVLSHDLHALLTTVNRQVSDVDVKSLVMKVTAAANAIETLAGSAETKAAIVNLNKAATDVQTFVVKLDAQVEPVQVELVHALRSFQEAADGIHRLLEPKSRLGEEAVRTLRQVTETAESFQRLADFLEQNPSALITGRKNTQKDP